MLVKPLPIVGCSWENTFKALVDMDCMMTLLISKVIKKWKGISSLQVINGNEIECKGSSDIEIAM